MHELPLNSCSNGLEFTFERDFLFFAERSRRPLRYRLIVLLSVTAGLRTAEIATLTWSMVLDPSGELGNTLELQDKIAKKRGGHSIPHHADLR